MIYGCARVRVKITRKKPAVVYYISPRDVNRSLQPLDSPPTSPPLAEILSPSESAVVVVAVIITTQHNIVGTCDLPPLPPPHTARLKIILTFNILCSYGFSQNRHAAPSLLYIMIIIIIASYARTLLSCKYYYYYYYNTSVVSSRLVLLCVVVLILTYAQYLLKLTRIAVASGSSPNSAVSYDVFTAIQ